MTLINVNDGTDFTEDAVALDNYVQFGAQIYNPAGLDPAGSAAGDPGRSARL